MQDNWWFAEFYQFRETAAPDLRASPDPDVLHIGSFLWCRDYLYLTTDWCFVLDDGNGTAKGYMICAPNTQDFVTRYKDQFWPVVARHGISDPTNETTKGEGLAFEFRKLVYDPRHMLQADYPDLLKDYPAHLHIDILPSHQGQCWGQRMLAKLLQELRGAGIGGIHLGMDAGNHQAHKFYDRVGFQRFYGMEENGELGRKGSAVYRVKKTSLDE